MFVIYLLLLIIDAIHSAVIAQNSFASPFLDHDHDGHRTISGWTVGGSTVIYKYFARLTQERQSRRGYLLGNNPLPTGLTNLDITMKFRISGSAKTFYGDGIAIWLTQNSYIVDTDFHGFSTKFYGFGVVIDTFRNTEHGSFHKDIALYINDGTRTLEAMQHLMGGCDVQNIRYSESRGDFSAITNTSVLKLIIEGTFLSIMIDPRNYSQFQHCTTVELPFPIGWLDKAKIAITSSTGALMDHHDVLGVQVASNLIPEPPPVDKPNVPPKSKKDQQYEELQSQLEHQIAKIKDSISESLENLRSKEALMEKKLKDVEEVLSVQTTSKIDQRIGTLEALRMDVVSQHSMSLQKRIDSASEIINTFEKEVVERLQRLEDRVSHDLFTKLENRVQHIEQSVNQIVDHRLNYIENSGLIQEAINKINTSASSSWHTPFIVIVLFSLGLISFVIYKLQLLSKILSTRSGRKV